MLITEFSSYSIYVSSMNIPRSILLNKSAKIFTIIDCNICVTQLIIHLKNLDCVAAKLTFET